MMESIISMGKLIPKTWILDIIIADVKFLLHGYAHELSALAFNDFWLSVILMFWQQCNMFYCVDYLKQFVEFLVMWAQWT